MDKSLVNILRVFIGSVACCVALLASVMVDTIWEVEVKKIERLARIAPSKFEEVPLLDSVGTGGKVL